VPVRSSPSFHPAVTEWFRESFAGPTRAQDLAWPEVLSRRSTLVFAPTGSGKTLAAFLAAIDRLMFTPEPKKEDRCRVLYVSPLRALAVDVERNLRAPLAGVARVAGRRGDPYRLPTVGVRTGDTPAAERARTARTPPDILITTPESLFLILTSNARRILASVEVAIVDEIHVLVGTKRGAHLALSLERLAEIARGPIQRIGLSATQRPLEEVARYLGGADGARVPRPRPVSIVDAGSRKAFDLTVEVPVEDMSRLGHELPPQSGDAPEGTSGVIRRRSIWPAIHPRLLELIRGHRSTLIFVNSRRLAERLAAALNELAGEELVRAHHGSIAREERLGIEEALKAGRLPAIVATSSLELGIDMGAIDLVVQVETPPSVASGVQRIGRASHQAGAVSRGVIFPKYRGDLLSTAAITKAMTAGQVEATRIPANPLDVLAQQIVAICAGSERRVDALYALVRRAAPFAKLPRAHFDGVLDMLSGRYPSDEFAELRPRLTWDRLRGVVRARDGAQRLAVTNAGTIPDRGLYGVFLAGGDAPPGRGGGKRVGELDEEMVFESHVGDVFVLGASSWRIAEITRDRVLVIPAPGEPGRMPFWKGDRPPRPVDLGRAIGRLSRELLVAPREDALERLVKEHSLGPGAARNLVDYLVEQKEATGALPDDRTLVLERTRDEMGDWRLCMLSPWGGRVHAPWTLALRAKLRTREQEIETLWSDDGIVVRLPDRDRPPDATDLLPAPEEIEDLVVSELGGTALFAAHFREAAGRALLLPRRRPGQRAPLWMQRKRAHDLLSVASRFASFPIVLETYRECLQAVFAAGPRRCESFSTRGPWSTPRSRSRPWTHASGRGAPTASTTCSCAWAIWAASRSRLASRRPRIPRLGSRTWSGRSGLSSWESAAKSDTRRSRTRAGFATPSASRCRPASPTPFSSPHPGPSSLSWRASPAPTARSRLPPSRGATPSKNQWSRRPSSASLPRVASSWESSGQGAWAASGAIREFSRPFGAAPWPGCASRWSRPIPPRWRASFSTGTAWARDHGSRGAVPTGSST
jgi:ATP-dependent Lhr-like helicase